MTIQKLNFEDYDLQDFFQNKDTQTQYEILTLLISDAIPYLSKYSKYISFTNGKDFMSNLSKEDMYGILQHTMADGKFIDKHNFDQIFTSLEETMAVIVSSLLFHAKGREKKNFGTEAKQTVSQKD